MAFRVHEGSPAQGEDQVVLSHELPHRFLLHPAEGLLPEVAEDVGDGDPGAPLNVAVQVNEVEHERPGELPPDAAFPHPHEPGEGDEGGGTGNPRRAILPSYLGRAQ